MLQKIKAHLSIDIPTVRQHVDDLKPKNPTIDNMNYLIRQIDYCLDRLEESEKYFFQQQSLVDKLKNDYNRIVMFSLQLMSCAKDLIKEIEESPLRDSFQNTKKMKDLLEKYNKGKL